MRLVLLLVACVVASSMGCESGAEPRAPEQTIEFIHSKTMPGAYVVKDATIHDAVRAVADQYDVHVGAVFRLEDGSYWDLNDDIEKYIPGAITNGHHTIELPGATLAEAVKAICKQYKGYVWEIEPDIANIYPEEPTPFDLVLKEPPELEAYVDDVMTEQHGVQFSESDPRGGEGTMISGCGWHWRRKQKHRLGRGDAMEKVILRNRSAREILNIICRTTPYACWVAQAGITRRVKDDSVDGWHEGLAYAIAHFDYNTFDSAPDDEVIQAYLDGHEIFRDWAVEEEFFRRLDTVLESFLQRFAAEKKIERRIRAFWHILNRDESAQLLREKREKVAEMAVKYYDTLDSSRRKILMLWHLANLRTDAGATLLQRLSLGKDDVAKAAEQILARSIGDQ